MRDSGRGERSWAVDPDLVDLAKKLSPEDFLRANGYEVSVSRDRRSLRVPGVLRADYKGGAWVSCDWLGGGIGDNIALARALKPGCGFAAAVRELAGVGDSGVPARPPPPPPPERDPLARPRLPPGAARSRGLDYLWNRGISAPTLERAERAGMLGFCESGVLFLGRDLGSPSREVRLATIRYFRARLNDDGDWITKRDLRDSHKAYPPLLPGLRARLAVVEGGVNALAVRDIHERRGERAPTVVATGGVGVRFWIEENPVLRRLVEEADLVEVWGENEVGRDGRPDPEKQARTDAMRDLLRQALAARRRGEIPPLVVPPEGAKDAADQNLAELDAPAPEAETPEAETPGDDPPGFGR